MVFGRGKGASMRMPPRWVVVVSLAVAATLPGDSLLYAVLPIVWAELGLELWMVGVLLSANRFVRLVTNPIAGWVVERTGVRVPFVLAVFASTATTATYGLGSGLGVAVWDGTNEERAGIGSATADWLPLDG